MEGDEEQPLKGSSVYEPECCEQWALECCEAQALVCDKACLWLCSRVWVLAWYEAWAHITVVD